MKNITILSTFFLLFATDTIFGQVEVKPAENDDVLQARLIKIKRMSRPWLNQNVELQLIDGMVHSGRFLIIREGAFHLNSDGRPQSIPFAKVETVVIKRKKRDLMIVGLASVGIGGLIAAGASLGFEAEGSEVVIAGLTGSIIGFTFGWKSFYRDVTIAIK